MSTEHFDEAQMLHPMTLVQRFLLSIPAFALLLVPVMRSSDSLDMVPVLTVVTYGVLALPLIALRYYRFRYRITPKEIIIHSGVFTRQNRSIPIERIQNIEIEQSLLPRMLGTAKVKIETAGSAKTEGVLEFVGIDTAHSIREIVRTYQNSQEAIPEIKTETVFSLNMQEEDSSATIPPAAHTPIQPIPQTATHSAPAENVPVFSLGLSRVALVGMMRFSLLYIAITFSLLEQMLPNPDEIEVWITKGWLKPLAEYAAASPWQLTAGIVVLAILLSWVSGILVSFNRFYGFKLWLESNKLHKRHGLLTLSQGTIPIPRVQTLILRANLLMKKLKWVTLEVQTMGLESTGRGHQVVAPLARMNEVMDIANHMMPVTIPEHFTPVSKLTIRRTIIRYSVALTVLVLAATYFWEPALWGFLGLIVIPFYAVQHFKNHGYALQENTLFVRRGVFKHFIWMIPVSKFQVLYAESSIFQRRLGLETVYMDTAGAGGFALPEIIDVRTEDAQTLVNQCYDKFQQAFVRP
ncbi:MAG: PH domain-containing protein [Rhodothermales bacterium]